MIPLTSIVEQLKNSIPFKIGDEVWVHFQPTPKSKVRVKKCFITNLTITLYRSNLKTQLNTSIYILAKDEEGIVNSYLEEVLYFTEVEALESAARKNIGTIQNLKPTRRIGIDVKDVSDIEGIPTKFFNKSKGTQRK